MWACFWTLGGSFCLQRVPFSSYPVGLDPSLWGPHPQALGVGVIRPATKSRSGVSLSSAPFTPIHGPCAMAAVCTPGADLPGCLRDPQHGASPAALSTPHGPPARLCPTGGRGPTGLEGGELCPWCAHAHTLAQSASPQESQLREKAALRKLRHPSPVSPTARCPWWLPPCSQSLVLPPPPSPP